MRQSFVGRGNSALFHCPACRLWEISENLHRAELSDVERSKLIEEWRELTNEKVSQVGTPLGGAQPSENGIRKTAQELGLTKNQVHRAHKIATITPEAHEAAREFGLDSNQSALLEARKQPTPEAQVESLRQPVERRRVTAGPRLATIRAAKDKM